MIGRKRVILIVALLLLIVTAAGVITLTAGHKKPAVSAVQMYSFNEDLEPVKRNDKYKTTYEIFVYSFCDSDGDGIGDINGIRSKLDYIQDMGFDQIWLTPVHPSPTYHKYDVCDYYDIDPVFGTLEDYELLLEDCHERGISVLMDLVLNHSSVDHEWFKQASDYLRELPEDWEPDSSYCRYFEYYNFTKTQQKGFEPLEGTDWYYEAQFWSGMPDLNLDSDMVRSEIKSIVEYWFDKGVDGFRLDAVTSYHTGSPEGNVEFTKYFCELCRKIKPDCYIVGEAWTDRNNIATLYSSGIDSLFNFPFSGNEGIIRNVIGESISPADFVHSMTVSDDAYRSNNPDYIDAPFYTNHDIARSAGYYAIDEGPQTKMAYALSLLMSGNSFMYYGEEIGMKGSGKDENKRAPMYWSDDPSDPDLCDGPPDMDDVVMKFPPLSEQINDDLSLYNWFRQVMRVRNAFPAISRGRVEECPELCSAHVAVFWKKCDSEQPVLIVINMGPDEEVCDLSNLSKDLKLSAVLNTSEDYIEFSDGSLNMPSMSIAVITE